MIMSFAMKHSIVCNKYKLLNGFYHRYVGVYCSLGQVNAIPLSENKKTPRE